MSFGKLISGVITLGLLSGCADPAVWSSIAPGYENGIALSRVQIDLTGMPTPQRDATSRTLVRELRTLGINASDDMESADAILTMDLIGQNQVTINVPLRHHPAETKITTYEKDGKTITEIKEYDSYTTGGYSYDVPEAEASFALKQAGSGEDDMSVWAAVTELRGQRNMSFTALSVDMARRTMRRLGQDKVILPVLQGDQNTGQRTARR